MPTAVLKLQTNTPQKHGCTADQTVSYGNNGPCAQSVAAPATTDVTASAAAAAAELVGALAAIGGQLRPQISHFLHAPPHMCPATSCFHVRVPQVASNSTSVPQQPIMGSMPNQPRHKP
eukprot:1141070-Pelagomonas_calceolata.AAC.1